LIVDFRRIPESAIIPTEWSCDSAPALSLAREITVMWPLVEVQHCILARCITQHGSHPIFNLLEVCYDYTVPPDLEFPKIVPRFDLFLRLVARDCGPTQLRICVHRLLRPGEWEVVNDYLGRVELAFPEDATVIRDESVRLANLRLNGQGLHAVTVHFRPVPDSPDELEEGVWNPDETSFDLPGWDTRGVEYFNVVRS